MEEIYHLWLLWQFFLFLRFFIIFVWSRIQGSNISDDASSTYARTYVHTYAIKAYCTNYISIRIAIPCSWSLFLSPAQATIAGFTNFLHDGLSHRNKCEIIYRAPVERDCQLAICSQLQLQICRIAGEFLDDIACCCQLGYIVVSRNTLVVARSPFSISRGSLYLETLVQSYVQENKNYNNLGPDQLSQIKITIGHPPVRAFFGLHFIQKHCSTASSSTCGYKKPQHVRILCKKVLLMLQQTIYTILLILVSIYYLPGCLLHSYFYRCYSLSPCMPC